MQLKTSQEKLQSLNNAEEILQSLQHEYELLVEQMTLYYEAKKKLIAHKREQLAHDVENSAVVQSYQEMKQQLAQRTKQWNNFRAQYA